MVVDPPSNTKAVHVAVGVSVVWAITKDKKVGFVKLAGNSVQCLVLHYKYTYTLGYTGLLVRGNVKYLKHTVEVTIFILRLKE